MLNETFTLTKRHIGWILIVGGVLGLIAGFGIDLFAIVRQGGFGSLFTSATVDYFRSPMGIGPTQRAGLMLCGVAIFIGLSLIPIKGEPA